MSAEDLLHAFRGNVDHALEFRPDNLERRIGDRQQLAATILHA